MLTPPKPVWGKTRVQSLVRRDDRAALRALLAVYSNQTPRERAYSATVEQNGLGFTGSDAPLLTRLAETYLKNGWLSEYQLGLLKERMPKYWRQLLDRAAARGHPVTYR